MNIHAILEQLESAFPEYVIKLDPVPDEEGLVSINVFGVSRADFHDVKESIFDLEEEFSGEEIFIPICYTKQEVFAHYPAIAEEYVKKQKIQAKRKEQKLLGAMLSEYNLLNCSCSQNLSSGLFGYMDPPEIFTEWRAGGHGGLIAPTIPDAGYALAA